MTFDEFSGPYLAILEMRNIVPSDDAVTLAYGAMADLDFQEFRAACEQWIRTAGAKDWPVPGEIRKLCPSGMLDEDRARVAWDVAKKAARRIGYLATVDFDDWIINAVIRAMGGWEKFGDWPAEETKFKEMWFHKKYLQVSRTGVGDGSPLMGCADRENQLKRIDRKEPVQRILTGLSQHPASLRLERCEKIHKRLESHPAAGIGMLPMEIRKIGQATTT